MGDKKYHDNGSAIAGDINQYPQNHVPHNALDRGWQGVPAKGTGEVTVDPEKLKNLAQEIDKDLTALGPALDLVMSPTGGGMSGAVFGPTGDAITHFTRLVSYTQTQFGKYFTDVKASYADVTTGLGLVKATYTTAGIDSTPYTTAQ
jgi:hypothetical protein